MGYIYTSWWIHGVLLLIDFGAYELMLKNIGYQLIETEWRIYAPVN